MEHFKNGCKLRFSIIKVTEITFDSWKKVWKKANIGATALRTIQFEEIQDVLLQKDRQLYHHVKFTIGFRLSGMDFSWSVITF